MEAPILSARGLGKSFAGRTVLRDVDLDIFRGEVHGLVGHNGSGKSTLVKILSGYHAPDRGATLSMSGLDVHLPIRPGEASLHGLAFVHQELALAPAMTVLENLRLGRYQTRTGWRISWRSERARVRRALDGFGMQCSPDALVSSLSEVERAMVAILRALDQVHDLGQGVLILDEPTAYLPRDGVTRLFSAVRSVAARGVGVLLVTHRLDEIRHYTERVTVLRNGELVASEQTSSLSEERLVELILGRTIDDMYPPSHSAEGDVALVVDGLRGPGLSSPLSLQVHAGEIVGLTGLVGMGYELPLYLLSGANQATAGTLSLFGSGVEINTMTPRRALDLGIALLPADRLGAGGAGAATVRENVTLPSLGQFFHLGVLRHRSEEASVGVLLERFSVIPPSPMAVFGTLSGGNQQKALMAKWFATEPKVLLLHEPTHGVDVGARQQLFSYIRDLAAAGTSVIIASAEYEDLARLCDRVLVFRNGAVVAAVSGSALTEERLVQLSFLDTSTVGASAVQP